MGKLVTITLGIEEIAFIPVLRVLKGLQGVADVDFNLDNLDAPRGGQRGPRKTNGHDAAPEPHSSVANIVLKELFDKGPQPRSVLNKIAVAHGFAAIDGRLNEMKKKGIIENIDGIWSVTKEFRAKIGEASAAQQPLRALPPPKKKSRPRSKFTARTYLLSALQKGNGQIKRPEAEQVLESNGIAKSGVHAHIRELRIAGLVKVTVHDDKTATYTLTAAGKKAKLPAELTQ